LWRFEPFIGATTQILKAIELRLCDTPVADRDIGADAGYS